MAMKVMIVVSQFVVVSTEIKYVENRVILQEEVQELIPETFEDFSELQALHSSPSLSLLA
jgi:hypothetical protein